MSTSSHTHFMFLALKQARLAEKKDEVPVGAVLVKNGTVVARGHNLTRQRRDPVAHAEMVALARAVKKLGNQRFLGCVLYVTLEPCAMCAGAIVQARLPTLVYAAPDLKAGACGGALKVIPNKKLNHRPTVLRGILKTEAATLLTSFFRRKRSLKRG